MSYGMPLEFRNSIDVNKFHNRSKKKSLDKNCTFKPELCPKSKMIAETKQYYENQPSNVFQRLIGNKNTENRKVEKNVPEFQSEAVFRPHINPISEEIDININMETNIPRWEKVSLRDLINFSYTSFKMKETTSTALSKKKEK